MGDGASLLNKREAARMAKILQREKRLGMGADEPPTEAS